MSITYNKFFYEPGNASALAVVKVQQINVSGQYRWRFYLNRAYVGATDPALQMVRSDGYRIELVPGSEKMGTELMHPRVVINVINVTAPVQACNAFAQDAQITSGAAALLSFVALRVNPLSVNHPELRGKYLTGPIAKVANTFTSLTCDAHP